MTYKFASIVVSFLLFSESLLAADFKIRAREHYEIHTVSMKDDSQVFKGFSNTINLWWEEPFKVSYGFAFSPVLANLKSDTESPLGDKIQYYNLGFEAKYFPGVVLENIYIRPGASFAIVKPGLGDDLTGFSLYAGLGYEFNFGGVGLAIEMANRVGFVSNSTTITSITPSLGVHFYDML